ncbi:MAG TPA: hypothetical protein VFY45_22185 [Baekduia sp.]|nr:hypothetical protein [Baekduia sp.]
MLPRAEAATRVGRTPKDGLQTSENGVDGVPFAPMSDVTGQDALFSVETIPTAQLQQQQNVDRPQGLASLVDRWPDDDDEALRFLEATLGS